MPSIIHPLSALLASRTRREWPAHDQPLLLGMGSEDRHSYISAPIDWCVVRAENLGATQLLAAIRERDFDAFNGLDLADIQFGGQKLAVKIDVRIGSPAPQLGQSLTGRTPHGGRLVALSQKARCTCHATASRCQPIGIFTPPGQLLLPQLWAAGRSECRGPGPPVFSTRIRTALSKRIGQADGVRG